MVHLVMDRAHREVVLELLEGLLDFGELQVIAPEGGRVLRAEIRSQQVLAFAPASDTQLVAVQSEGKGLGVDRWSGCGSVIATRA